MRKLVLALAASGSALAVAAPASAQYYPQSYSYGDNGHGYNGYGYNGYGYNNWGQARGFQQRIYNVLRSLDGVRWDQRERLRYEAINLDRQLRIASRNGLNPYEARSFDVRIGQLECRQQYASGSRYGRYGYNDYTGYYGDRDGYDRGRERRHERHGDDDDDD